jgi:hypothetical protein
MKCACCEEETVGSRARNFVISGYGTLDEEYETVCLDCFSVLMDNSCALRSMAGAVAYRLARMGVNMAGHSPIFVAASIAKDFGVSNEPD